MKASVLFGVDYARWIEAASAGALLLVVAAGFYLTSSALRSSFVPFTWLAATLVPFSVAHVPYYAWVIPAVYVLLSASARSASGSSPTLGLCPPRAARALACTPSGEVKCCEWKHP